MSFVISHKYKFIYVHIPKTGGTSLDSYLKEALPSSDEFYDHKPVWFAEKYMKDYFKWATLRNPFDRSISIYHTLCNAFGDRPFSEFIQQWIFNDLPQFAAIMPQEYWVKDIKHKVWIDRFVNFKNLVPETLDILKSLGVPTDKSFPWIRKSDRKPWEEYYNEDDKWEVEHAFREDFELCRDYL